MAMPATANNDFWGVLLARSSGRAAAGQFTLPKVLDNWNLGEVSAQSVVCPSCGHHAVIFVDTFAGNQRYVEDCSVCCRAIELTIQVREYQVCSVEADRPF